MDQGSLFELDAVRVKSNGALVGKPLDRKSVTQTEAILATQVLDAYNEIAGTNLSGQMWLKKIVLRLREHPELSAEDHRRVIERNFADPWWKNDPSPSVIYGNDGVFERAMLVTGKRQPRTHAERKSARLRKLMGR